MHQERSDRIDEGAAQIDITGFVHPFTLPFALADAGVIASAGQARTTKHLASVAIVGRVTHSGGQAGDLDRREPFEFGPDRIGSLVQQGDLARCQGADVVLHRFQQGQIVLQEFATNGHQFGIGQQRFLGMSNDFPRSRWSQGIVRLPFLMTESDLGT